MSREIGQMNPIGIGNLVGTALLEIEQGGVSFNTTVDEVLALKITNLSEVIIDANKDWLGFDITNLGNLQTNGYIDINEIATPANPAANVGRLYVKDVAAVTQLFFRDSVGLETNLLAIPSEVFLWTADHSTGGFALLDSNFADGIDPTKIISMNLSGMGAGIVLTLASIQTTNQTITIPNITGADVFVTENLSQTLANKTITLPTIADFTNSQHNHEDVVGGGLLVSTLALSDTADIAYLNTPNVYVAGVRQDFLGLVAGTAGLNVGAILGNPTTQLDGDLWYNSSINKLFGRINGADIDLGQMAEEFFVWTANHSYDTFALIGAGTQVTSRINLLNADEIGWENNAGTANLTINSSVLDDFVFAAGWNNIDHNLHPLINTIIDIDATGNQIVQGTPTVGQYLRDNGTEFLGAAIVSADLPANVVRTDQANVFGDFAQTFADNQFFIQNPAGSFTYQFIGDAIIADRTVTLPVLATNDTFVFEAHTQTLTNKTLGTGTVFSVIPVINDGITFTFNPNSVVAGINVGQFAGEPSAPVNGDIVYDSAAGELKGFANGVWENLVQTIAPPFSDDTSIVEGTGDPTKELRFEVDGNASGIIGIIATTFSTPKTITLPDANDILVGRSTTDVLINKTIDGNFNVLLNINETQQTVSVGAVGTVLTSNGVGLAPTYQAVAANPPFPDNLSIVEGDVDPTKQLRIEVDGNTAAIVGVFATIFTTAKTLTFPDATDTLVGKATSDSFTNKIFDVDAFGNQLIQGTPVAGQYLRDNGAEFVGANITSADLPGDVVLTGQPNSFGNFPQLFPDDQFFIGNPAATFTYQFQGNAITADRIVHLPVLISDDTFVFEAHIQTLTNKSLDAGTAVDAAIVWGSQRQTFNPNNNLAGINVGSHPSQPTIPVNGDLVYNSGVEELQAYINGAWQNLKSSTMFVSSYNTEDAPDGDFFGISGHANASSGTELNLQVPMAEPLFLHTLGVHINANGQAGAVSWTIRINGVDGNQTATIPAATTGFFQDVTNSDTVAIGDLVCYQITGIGAGALNVTGSSLLGDRIA